MSATDWPDFDAIVRERRCVRGFDAERPVPREVIREVFQLAQHAPSNCNVQPWRVVIASGATRDRLKERLCAAFDSGDMGDPEDPIDTFPDDYRRLQVACAVEMYGKMGVARGDWQGRMAALRRNFELFDAPHVAVVGMDKRFGVGVAVDVGIYVQTVLLSLWSRGIGSCPQAALRQYPDIVRETLGIPESTRLLCGIAFGYEDPDVPANGTRQPREPLENNVQFLD